MPRKAIKGVFTQSMDIKGKPIVEDSKLPNMDDAIKKGTIKTTSKTQKLMDDAPPKIAARAGTLMPAFKADKTREKPIAAAGLPDQVAKAVRKSADDSYVVLRMHVQNGEMTVVGSKRVDGPLANYDELVQSGLTYEATLDEARLAIGSVADFGEQRSYPRPGEHEHHIKTLPSFDFNLKIPGSTLAAKDLPKLKISLYRFKEPLIQPKLGAAPIAAQFEREARVVAELNGIRMADLRPDVKDTIKKTFGK